MIAVTGLCGYKVLSNSQRGIIGRIGRTLSAYYWGALQEIIFQLFSGYIWISTWGVEVYAEWLILFLVPILIERGNAGVFNSVTSSLISYRKIDNKVEARQTFRALLDLSLIHI